MMVVVVVECCCGGGRRGEARWPDSCFLLMFCWMTQWCRFVVLSRSVDRLKEKWASEDGGVMGVVSVPGMRDRGLAGGPCQRTESVSLRQLPRHFVQPATGDLATGD